MLQNVLYISQFRHNLISVSTLTHDSNSCVVFSTHSYTIQVLKKTWMTRMNSDRATFITLSLL